MHTEIDRTNTTSPNELVAVDDCVASREWRADFARIYAARESCTSGQASRAASILCESLCLLPPLEAVATVFADSDLLAALRIATRAARDSRPAEPIAGDFSAVAY